MGFVVAMSSRNVLRVGSHDVMPSGAFGNLLHIVTFALLGHALARAFDPAARPAGFGRSAGVLAFAVATLFGCSDEVHQFFTPGRHCSLYDAFLDAAGAACALLVPRPPDVGRPATWQPAATLLFVAVVVAIVTGLWRLPGDAAIESILRSFV
jgi:hypothetical protein